MNINLLKKETENSQQSVPEGTIRDRRDGIILETGLEEFTGEWNKHTAAHLLRRTTFGPTMGSIKEFSEYTLEEAIDKILDFDTATDQPINFSDDNDPYTPKGMSWVGAPYIPTSFGHRLNSFSAWWFGKILNSGNNIGEQMTLFWHNHFVTQMLTVRNMNFTYKYHKTLRENALGNFRTLVEDITVDPAMLRYLNGAENIVGKPNENYARELFELFTIGKGPLKAPGDYTTYTEDDVIEASKVLTGWRVYRDAVDSGFFNQAHDRSDKKFSPAFNNTVISNNGANEYKDLIDMILKQEETAKFICRKLYRWFVYYQIDEQTEQNVIEPLANVLRSNNYEIKPTLKALFKSAHFFDAWNRGCVIKSPLNYVTNIYRNLEAQFPNEENLEGQYRVWLVFGFQYTALQEMTLGEPPSVAGWPALYQDPGYHRLWITSVSAPYRGLLADAFSTQKVLKQRKGEIKYNPFELAKQVSDPYDPNVLVKEFSELLHPVDLTQNQLDYLKSNLLPQDLEDYNWGIVWNEYLINPENETNTNTVDALLRSLIRACLNIAECHLS